MPMKPYEEVAPEPLAFPIGRKTYVVQPVGWNEGLRITEMIQAGPNGKFTESADDLWRMILGKTYDQMKKDNVPGDALARAAFTALTDFQFGREAAEAIWESGVDPKALTERLAQRAPKQPQDRKPPATPRSRSTASGSRTSKASTRSTTSRTR